LHIAPPEWAQPVEVQYNLFQMSPTSTAAPAGWRRGAVAEKPQSGDGDQLPAGADSSWLSEPGINQVQLPYRTNHVDDADVLKTLRAIQAAEANGRC
jgi:hypothetical protein